MDLSHIKPDVSMEHIFYVGGKFRDCMSQHLTPERLQKAWSVVQHQYSRPHRFYHTLRHIHDVLKEAESYIESTFPKDGSAQEMFESSHDAFVIYMSLIFHDFIYDVGYPLNEPSSAASAVSFLPPSVDPGDVFKINTCILATWYSQKLNNLPYLTCQIVVDCDLSGFGLPEDEFVAQSHRVWREISETVTIEFLDKQLGFLHTLLGSERIYKTDFFRDKYEAKARANIHKEISRIAQLKEELFDKILAESSDPADDSVPGVYS